MNAIFSFVILPDQSWDPLNIAFNRQCKGEVGPMHKFKESYVLQLTNVSAVGVTAGKDKRVTGGC